MTPAEFLIFLRRRKHCAARVSPHPTFPFYLRRIVSVSSGAPQKIRYIEFQVMAFDDGEAHRLRQRELFRELFEDSDAVD